MNVREIDAAAIRKVDRQRFPSLGEQFPRRWSPRAMAGTPLRREDLETLIEAARWAPSCYNAQPWRFAYALRDDAHWPKFVDALLEGNRRWAVRAGALIAVAARSRYERNDEPAPTHRFDAGAAWMSLALQAAEMGLVAHGMWGFHQDGARRSLALGAAYDLCAMVAVGHPGERDDLPESLRDKESPSDRKSQAEICAHGTFAGIAGADR